jgi:hypothetical protein
MRLHASKLLILFLLAVAFGLPVSAQTAVPTRVPTIDQSLEMHRVGRPRISPDGKGIAVVLSKGGTPSVRAAKP